MIKFESEKKLEEFIADCFHENSHCIVCGDYYEGLVRQFNAGEYGIPDLVFYSEDIDEEGQSNYKRLHVIELKNEPIQSSHIAQIARYKRYFELAFKNHEVDMQFTLVVPKSVEESGDTMWLIDSLENIKIVEFSLSPKTGIEFKESSGWYKVGKCYKGALDLFGFAEEI
jgi:hypothetical protein